MVLVLIGGEAGSAAESLLGHICIPENVQWNKRKSYNGLKH